MLCIWSARAEASAPAAHPCLATTAAPLLPWMLNQAAIPVPYRSEMAWNSTEETQVDR